MPACGDPVRELELPGHRLVWMLAADEHVPPLLERRVRDRHHLAEHLLRRLGDPDVVAARFRHLQLAVGPDEQRERHHHLRREPVLRHHVAPGEQVEPLVCPADLDVRLDRDRVVRLHDRVQELRERDRDVGGEALGEVVALEETGDRHRACESHRIGVGERA